MPPNGEIGQWRKTEGEGANVKIQPGNACIHGGLENTS